MNAPRYIRWIPLALLAALAALGNTVHGAEDQGLYDPAIPQTAALVRVFNSSDTVIQAMVGGKQLGGVQPLEASPYVVVEPGEIELAVAGHRINQTVSMRRYYTLVVAGHSEQAPEWFDDGEAGTPRKARIYVYNVDVSDRVTLETAERALPVVADVGQGQHGQRDVNELKIGLRIRAGDDTVVEQLTYLRRGRVYSYFVFGNPNPRVAVRESTVNTRI